MQDLVSLLEQDGGRGQVQVPTGSLWLWGGFSSNAIYSLCPKLEEIATGSAQAPNNNCFFAITPWDLQEWKPFWFSELDDLRVHPSGDRLKIWGIRNVPKHFTDQEGAGNWWLWKDYKALFWGGVYRSVPTFTIHFHVGIFLSSQCRSHQAISKLLRRELIRV